MEPGEAEAILRRAIGLAIAGNEAALRMVLDRISPVPRGALVNVPDFPQIKSIEDVPKALAHLANAVARGVISADDAANIATVIDKFTAAINGVDFDARLRSIEADQAEAASASGRNRRFIGPD